MKCGKCGRRTHRRTQYIDGTPYGPTCAAKIRGKAARVKAKASKGQLELDFNSEHQEQLPLVVNPDHWQVIDTIQQQIRAMK